MLSRLPFILPFVIQNQYQTSYWNLTLLSYGSHPKGFLWVRYSATDGLMTIISIVSSRGKRERKREVEKNKKRDKFSTWVLLHTPMFGPNVRNIRPWLGTNKHSIFVQERKSQLAEPKRVPRITHPFRQPRVNLNLSRAPIDTISQELLLYFLTKFTYTWWRYLHCWPYA